MEKNCGAVRGKETVKTFFYKCSNSGRNESTPQTQNYVSWISSKAELEISFLNSTGLNLLQGANFQRFLSGKSVFLNSKLQIREFVYVEWSEEKFLKGSVGRQMKLCF